MPDAQKVGDLPVLGWAREASDAEKPRTSKAKGSMT